MEYAEYAFTAIWGWAMLAPLFAKPTPSVDEVLYPVNSGIEVAEFNERDFEDVVLESENDGSLPGETFADYFDRLSTSNADEA